MPPAPKKINLASDLQSRDGTLNYDGRIQNGYVEKMGDSFRVYKRTGLTHLFSAGVSAAHGITNYVDSGGVEKLLWVSGNTMYIPTPSVPTTSAADTWTVSTPPIASKDTTYFSFNGKLWAVQNNSGGTASDVFSKATASTSSWTTEATSAFSTNAVGGNPVIALNGILYLIASQSASNGKVWRSYDGVTWTLITSTAAIRGGSQESEVAVLGNKIYFASGNNGGVGTNAVWSSSDGITWTSLTTNPGWEATNDLNGFRMVSAQRRLWVMGGYGFTAGALRNKVYYSTDGITWTNLAQVSGFTAREWGDLMVLNDTLFLYVGGLTNTTGPVWSQDSWTSVDGATWTQQQTTTVGGTFFGSGGTQVNQGFTMDDGTIVIGSATTANTDYQYGYVTPSGASSGGLSTTLAVTPVGFADFATTYTRSQVMVRFNNAAYKFDPIGSTLTLISDADYPVNTVRGCVYLDGTFYVMDANGTIYGSAIDDCTSWDPLNFVSAEADPDQGVFLAKKDAYVVAMGSQTIQYFWDAANATGSPLSPVQSGVINIGCAHGYSVQQMESSVIFMAQRKAVGTSFQKGRFIAMLTDGLNYKVISTPDVDRVLNADDLATIYSCVSAENGHNFYHLLLGTSGITLTYDLTTGLWGTWTRSTATGSKSISALTQSLGTATATSTAHGLADGDEIVVSGASPSGYNGTFNITYVDANTFTYPVSSALTTPATGTITAVGSTESYFDMVASCSYNGTQVFQGQSDGYIWQMLDTNTQDNSVSINFKARTPRIDYGNIYWKFPYMLTFMGDVSRVSGDVGLLRYTDDDYATYSNYRQFDITDTYSNLHRFGKYRRRAWEWRHTRAAKHFIDFLQEDVAQGNV